MIRRFYVTVNGRGYEVEVEEVSAFPRPVTSAPRAMAEQQELRLSAPAAPMESPAATAQAAPAEPPVQSASAAPKAVPLPPGGTIHASPQAMLSATAVTSPMPGKILSVKVTVGQTVKRGDVLMILEAMKMENEIQSPADGMVSAIAAEVGQMVEAGAALASIG